jgi:hypothetical protein
MKKFISISLSFLLAISVMHISIASHFCGKELAATRISVSGIPATCGMETDKDHAIHFASHCCDNHISVYSVDDNYSTSSFNIKDVTKSLLQVFIIPVTTLFSSHDQSVFSSANVSPPEADLKIASFVEPEDICVFRL